MWQPMCEIIEIHGLGQLGRVGHVGVWAQKNSKFFLRIVNIVWIERWRSIGLVCDQLSYKT